jgi:hypothetical protein
MVAAGGKRAAHGPHKRGWRSNAQRNRYLKYFAARSLHIRPDRMNTLTGASGSKYNSVETGRVHLKVGLWTLRRSNVCKSLGFASCFSCTPY